LPSPASLRESVRPNIKTQHTSFSRAREADNSPAEPDWYTITAVGQDEFEDVKVPEVPIHQAQEINKPKK
jgi:hypothetical protein